MLESQFSGANLLKLNIYMVFIVCLEVEGESFGSCSAWGDNLHGELGLGGNQVDGVLDKDRVGYFIKL